MRLSLVLAAALAGAAPVLAQDLAPVSDPDRILIIARGWGGAEIEQDEDGDPMIRGRIDGQAYRIYFYGCTLGRACASLEFWTYLKRTDLMTPDSLNAWNLRKRFVNAAFDEDGDMALTMDVNLFGGVSARSLDDTFDWWRTMLDTAHTDFVEGGKEDGMPVLPEAGPAPQKRRIDL